MSEQTDLEILFPGREVTCKGETIKVVPLFFGQYPTAAKLARPLAMALFQSGLLTVKDEVVSISPELVTALPVVLDEGGEAFMAFFAFAIGKPRKWFDTLPGDEGIDLAMAILEENRDFFVRRLLPKLKAAGLLKVWT